MPPNVKPCHMKMFSRSYKSYRTYKSCTCEGALDCFEGRGFVCQTLTSNIIFTKTEWIPKKSKQNNFLIKLPYRTCLSGTPGHIKLDLCLSSSQPSA
ncbi:uncharacterized protein [Montipora foliosa]|uniref:uncharacterized protein isoform X2 n=1 Tax=Montipora foliosa TaxID=591990 RepID=UPI0035F1F2CB